VSGDEASTVASNAAVAPDARADKGGATRKGARSAWVRSDTEMHIILR